MDDTVGLVIVKFRSSLVIPVPFGSGNDGGQNLQSDATCPQNDRTVIPAKAGTHPVGG